MSTAKNMQYLRTSNRAAIIKALTLGSAANRMDLSLHLGLSKMAISELVNDLIAEGILQDRKYSPFKDATWYSGCASGRKPSVLSILPLKINAVGILIKRFEVHCLIAEIQGNILYHDKCILPENADNDYLSSVLISLIEKALLFHSDLPVAGIGIASIGPLDIYQKRLLFPPDFCNIGDLPLGKLLEGHFQLPVYLDNDMNASAIAEQFFGVGKMNKTLAYVGFGTGVGAGIIFREKLLHGSAGFAGEIGHVSIDPAGSLCSCGQHGCIETYTGISHFIKEAGFQSAGQLREAYSNDTLTPQSAERIRQCRNALQTLLVTISNLYDPEIIIFGEVPPDLAFIYLDGLEDYMNRHMFHHGFQKIRLCLSSFGEDAPLMGSVSLVFQKIFDGVIPI